MYFDSYPQIMRNTDNYSQIIDLYAQLSLSYGEIQVYISVWRNTDSCPQIMEKYGAILKLINYCKFENFHVTFILQIFHFRIIREFLNSQFSTQPSKIAV